MKVSGQLLTLGALPQGRKSSQYSGGGGGGFSRTGLGPVAKTKTWTQLEIEPRIPGHQACNVFTTLTDLSNPVYARGCQRSAFKVTQSESHARRRMNITVSEDKVQGAKLTSSTLTSDNKLNMSAN
jgi:hypothetical protein